MQARDQPAPRDDRAPLARLIGTAVERTQLLVVTHSERLADILDVEFAARILRLEKVRGETCIVD